MRLTELTVHNYKSLREVTFRPSAFNVLVGPNDSGKSNFADALDFLSIVYRDGLSAAVARKGGFENIAYRKEERSTVPIGFSLEAEGTVPEDLRKLALSRSARIRYRHAFHFGTRGTELREEYFVDREVLTVALLDTGSESTVLSVRRVHDDVEVDDFSSVLFPKALTNDRRVMQNALTMIGSAATSVSSVIATYQLLFPNIQAFVEHISSVRVFQFSPLAARRSGPPMSDVRLDRYGENLPAVIDSLQRDHPNAWDAVFSTMRVINPRLKGIRVEPTTSRLLGLFFDEEGVGRPWTADEVSDGTVQSLAILTAIFDPTSTFLVIEEPENSVHPWIVRNIVDACRTASNQKQILLTTHSPVLLDAVLPEDLWLVWRNGKGSHVERLQELEPGFEQSWKEGAFSISEFLNTGILRKYVPAGLRGDEDETETTPEAD